MIGLLIGANAGGSLPGAGHPFWYSPDPTAPQHVAEDVSVSMAMRISAVYACVRVLAESVATLPLITYRRTPDGGKERATDHPVYELLHDAPSAWSTAVEFIELGMYQLSLRGNMLAMKTLDSLGNVQSLSPIDPDKVTDVRLAGPGRFPTYRIDGRDVSGENLLHVRGLSPDSLWGLSPIRQMQLSLSLSRAAESFGHRYFANGIRPAGSLEFPNALSDKAYHRLRESINTEHAGQQHKAMILEEGGKWSQISIAPEEAQFLETRQFQVAEVCRMFRVPPHMIQDLTHATFSNIEHQGIDFVVHTIRPWLVRIERAIQRDVIRDPSVVAEFLADALVRGDQASRYAAYATAIQNEFLSPNEVRARENMNPRDGGDTFRNPAINPQQLEAEPVGVDESPVATAFARDIAGRLANHELREVEKRAKHAGADRERWDQWLAEFYGKHAEYADAALSPLCGAMGMQEVRRVELVNSIVADSLAALRGGDPVQVVESWRCGESRAAHYAAAIKGAMP